MAYPESFINELKLRNPIEDVVSRYVELKRAGRNLVGRCPFHSERSPSFTVFSDHFHCFGCSAGGDVITFIMRIENLDYKDTISFLADRSGMTVPEDTRFIKKKQTTVLTRERAFAMNKSAAKIFHENLFSPDAKQAQDYLNSRQLPTQFIRHFGLGYAKNSFSDLLDKLTKLGYSVDEIKENFLCGVSQKTSRPFDMFRNRIMFPIIDTSGNVVAFGGRVLDDSKPKYLNSSDTVVFNKSKNLFALNFAKNVLLGNTESELVKSGEIILCEGYMDVIALHKAGFTNAVATLGTAITSEHARIVSRYAKTAFLAYDSDEAGKKAADKAIKLLTEAGVDAKVIVMDGAKDPDEYINKFGPVAFSKLLSGSVGQVDYRLNNIISKYNLSLPDDKIRALNECCELLSTMTSAIKRDVYVQRLSQMTGVSVDSINVQLGIAKKRIERKQKKSFDEENQKKLLRFNDRVNPQAVSCPAACDIEERIIGIILLFPEHLEKCDKLYPEDFITDFNKTVFENILNLYNESNFDISQLNSVFNPEQMSRIYQMKQMRSQLTSNGLNALNEQISFLKKQKDKLLTKQNKIQSDDQLLSVIQRVRQDKGLK